MLVSTVYAYVTTVHTVPPDAWLEESDPSIPYSDDNALSVLSTNNLFHERVDILILARRL
jgi:hypothetical protein